MSTALEREQKKQFGTTLQPAGAPPKASLQRPKINFRPDTALLDESYAPRVGDKVFWFPTGDITNSPHVAFVTMDSNLERVLSLAVVYPGMTGVLSYQSVKHYSTPGVSEKDRNQNGFWAWNRCPPKDLLPPAPPKQ